MVGWGEALGKSEVRMVLVLTKRWALAATDCEAFCGSISTRTLSRYARFDMLFRLVLLILNTRPHALCLSKGKERAKLSAGAEAGRVIGRVQETHQGELLRRIKRNSETDLHPAATILTGVRALVEGATKTLGVDTCPTTILRQGTAFRRCDCNTIHPKWVL
jgi:hypothetical protein